MTTPIFRRLTVEEVRRAKAKTGAKIVQGLCIERDDDDLLACPIGVIALAEYGLETDDTEEAAERLGLREAYWSSFIEAFDHRRCPPPSEENRAVMGDHFELAMAGWQDARSIARDLFGEGAVS